MCVFRGFSDTVDDTIAAASLFQTNTRNCYPLKCKYNLIHPKHYTCLVKTITRMASTDLARSLYTNGCAVSLAFKPLKMLQCLYDGLDYTLPVFFQDE
jgi:hypothetical protein